MRLDLTLNILTGQAAKKKEITVHVINTDHFYMLMIWWTYMYFLSKNIRI